MEFDGMTRVSLTVGSILPTYASLLKGSEIEVEEIIP